MYVEMILAVMLQGPVWAVDADETPEQRRQLYMPVAQAIEAVARETDNPVRSAAILIALGQNETAFSRYVLEGRCLDGPPGMRCDYDPRTRKPLSRGPFQVRKWCKAQWAAKEGSYESFVEGARCALGYVNKGLQRCLKTPYRAWQGAFAVYRGQSCSDGGKTGPNFKAHKYTRSMIVAEQKLKEADRNQSRQFLAYLRQSYKSGEAED